MKGTIKSSSEISALFEGGERITTTSMIALALRRRQALEKGGRQIDGRIAVVAGRRLGSSPQRNKAKRRIREAARLAKAPWRGFDVVLVARDKILTSSFETIAKDMERIALRIKRAEE